MRSNTNAGLLTGLGLLTTAAFVLSMLVGSSELTALAALQALFGSGDAAELARTIMSEIRFPRAVLGLCIGAILGMSGAALQGYLRNPLAEAGIIGVSAGGALGAVLAIHTGLAAAFSLALPFGGLLGAFAAVAILIALVGRDGGPLTLILAGVAVSSFAAALISLVLNFSDNPFATVEMVFWMLGSLADRSISHVQLAVPLIALSALAFWYTRPALDALTLGQEVAQSLGVDLNRTRWLIVGATAVGIGAATAVSGAIGFVGLVVPHLLRPIVGYRPSALLPASALGGATLLLMADTAVRLMRDGSEMKLGVLTALIGAPFFFLLVIRTRRELVA